jgi:hypothetical protein
MPPCDYPNSTIEPSPEPIVTDNDAERAFEREAEQAEMEAALEQDRERTSPADGVR